MSFLVTVEHDLEGERRCQREEGSESTMCYFALLSRRQI